MQIKLLGDYYLVKDVELFSSLEIFFYPINEEVESSLNPHRVNSQARVHYFNQPTQVPDPNPAQNLRAWANILIPMMNKSGSG